MSAARTSSEAKLEIDFKLGSAASGYEALARLGRFDHVANTNCVVTPHIG